MVETTRFVDNLLVFTGNRTIPGLLRWCRISPSTDGWPLAPFFLARSQRSGGQSETRKKPTKMAVSNSFQFETSSVVQWHQFFFPFFLVAAPLKWSKPKKRVPFFSRVTEQLSLITKSGPKKALTQGQSNCTIKGPPLAVALNQ